jgi:hypothetical protein
MKKYCIDCGFENTKEDKFCRNCGKELVDLEAVQEPKKELTTKKKPEQKISEKKTKIVEPKKETIKEEKPKYHISEIRSEKIIPTPKKESPKDMSKKMMMMVGIAIILSIVAILIAFLVQPSFEIGEQTVGTDELKNNAVTGNQVLDGSLTDLDITNSGISKIAPNSIKGDMILSDAITIAHLSDNVISSISGQVNITNNSITSEKIANKEIKTEDLDDDSITSAKIKDGEVTSGDIAADAVTSSEIEDNAVGSSEIAAGAVGSSEIASGAVDTPDIANGAVTYEKMEIKITCGLATNVQNQSTISHGLTNTPTSVIVTPVHDSSILGGGYVLYANVYNVDANSFDITLWYELEGGAGTINEVDGTAPWDTIDVYWIAMYRP